MIQKLKGDRGKMVSDRLSADHYLGGFFPESKIPPGGQSVVVISLGISRHDGVYCNPGFGPLWKDEGFWAKDEEDCAKDEDL